jgi:hypothetical protein
MNETKHNYLSGTFLIVLMFVFFSFLHSEKERQTVRGTMHHFVASDVYASGLQAISGPEISTPQNSQYPLTPVFVNGACLDCIPGCESVYNKQVSCFFSSSRFKFPFEKPVIGLVFLRKIPEQGKDDDPISLI